MNRRNFLTTVFLAGGLAIAGAAVMMPRSAPVSSVVTEYDGPDDPAALQTMVARESQDKFVMVMFHATWCPYCKKLTDQLDAAAAKSPAAYGVLKVDAEKYGTISGAFKKDTGIPETHVFLNGQQVDMFVGTASDDRMIVNYLRDLQQQHQGPVTKPYISKPNPQASYH